MTNLDSILKSRDITLPTKIHLPKLWLFIFCIAFSGSHVCIRELNYKTIWVLKRWCFWTVVLEKTFDSPLNCKEIQPVHPKGNQSWIFIGRTDAEAEDPILGPPDRRANSWKTPWCLERLKAEGEGDNIGWDSWMTSLSQCTCVCANSGRWWRTGSSWALQFILQSPTRLCD